MVHPHFVDFVEQKEWIAHAALAIFCSNLPGMEPMYVRRWPRISASSRTPPKAMRMNLRLVEQAIDSPSEVLPPVALPYNWGLEFAHTLLHREVFKDALFNLFQAKMILEHRVRASDRVVLYCAWQGADHPIQITTDDRASAIGDIIFNLLSSALAFSRTPPLRASLILF